MLRKWMPWIGVLVLALSVAACAPTQATTTAAAPAAASPLATTAPAEAPTEAAPATVPAVDATAAAASGLTTEEVADLLHMREEEKLARDVYLTLYDKWGAQVFQNIAGAEQTHMDAVKTLLTTYGIADPVAQTQDQRGVFTDPKLQALYDQLVSKGSASLVDALTVGATIEDLDIKDLNDAMARTDKTDIRSVYENLKMGSESHMRAFVSNLRAQGADYTPQYITEEEFQQILQGSSGRGQGQGNGQGPASGG